MKHIHADIANKPIESIYQLTASFDLFAEEGADIDGDTLWANIVETIQTCHHEATPETIPGHPRPIWKLDIAGFYFYYQVLSDRIEVGDIVSTATGFAFEPTQDLMAEFTAEENA